MTHSKKISIHLCLLSIAGCVVALLVLLQFAPPDVNTVSAQQAGNQVIPITGWAWGLNTDSNNSVSVTGRDSVPNNARIVGMGNNSTLEFLNVVPTPGNPAGPGWVELGGLNFVKNISTQTGYIAGYLWSLSLGWIEFATSTTGCPTVPCNATVDSSGNVSGWARIVSIRDAGADNPTPRAGHPEDPPLCGNAGGIILPGGTKDCFKGWIHLNWSGSAVSDERLRIVDTTFVGYAWSNEYGWLKFDGALGTPIGNSSSRCVISANPSPTTGPSRITWTCNDIVASTCKLFQDVRTLPPLQAGSANSSRNVDISSFRRSVMYEIVCEANAGGEVSAQTLVQYGSEQTASCALTATPDVIRLAQGVPTGNATVSWSCSNVQESTCVVVKQTASMPQETIQAFGGHTNNPTPGGEIVPISKTTLFAVSCRLTDNSDTVESSDTVRVIPPGGIIECTPGSQSPDCPR